MSFATIAAYRSMQYSFMYLKILRFQSFHTIEAPGPAMNCFEWLFGNRPPGRFREWAYGKCGLMAFQHRVQSLQFRHGPTTSMLPPFCWSVSKEVICWIVESLSFKFIRRGNLSTGRFTLTTWTLLSHLSPLFGSRGQSLWMFHVFK